MGRGGGGSGKGGVGGRAGRSGPSGAKGGGGGGGGASSAADEVGAGAGAAQADAANAAAGQIYKESPSQMAQAQQNFETMSQGNMDDYDRLYADIPEPNVKMVGGHKVVDPGSAGAPKIGEVKYTVDEARDVLLSRGVPIEDISTMRTAHGAEGVQHIATLVAENPNATWINSGIEGMVFNWSESQIIRVQYNIGQPPPSFYVGKAGAYPQWKQTYGGVVVEGKERIWDTISRLQNKGYMNPVGARIGRQLDEIQRRNAHVAGFNLWDAQDALRDATITKYVMKENPRLTVGDAHANNWGLDFKGRLRVIDPGAYVPQGHKVTGQF